MEETNRGDGNGKSPSLPWKEALSYSTLVAGMTDEEREAYILRVIDGLIESSDREWNADRRSQLVETLQLFLVNETFSFTDQDGVGYVWNVTKALKIIKESPRETVMFAPAEQGVTIEHIRQRYPDIDLEKAKKTDLSQPLLFIPFQGNSLLVDGWHRLARAVLEGVEELPCYLLTEEEADSVLVLLEPLPGKGKEGEER